MEAKVIQPEYRFVHVPEIARMFGVSVRTLNDWHRSGRFVLERLSPRVVGAPLSRVLDFMHGRGLGRK